LSSKDNLVDADSIANIANDILVKIGYTHHTVRELRKNGRVWKLLAEADKVELTMDEKGKVLGYMLHKS
jgi:hypothetical protein